jgi:type VI secretion system secreted protein Hcp
MAVQIYVTITGAKQGAFKGESTQKGRENMIPGVAFAYGVTVPHDIATGQASGKRQHQPVVFTKEWGASSPQFYVSAFTNEVLTSVVLNFFVTRANGVQQLDHTVKLTNAIIVSVQQSLHLPQQGGPVIDSRELEEISFTFQKIDITSISGGTEAVDDWNVTV